MNATVTFLYPRLRLIDCAKRAEREGKRLEYRRHEGIAEKKCRVCGEVIQYGLCGCSPTAA